LSQTSSRASSRVSSRTSSRASSPSPSTSRSRSARAGNSEVGKGEMTGYEKILASTHSSPPRRSTRASSRPGGIRSPRSTDEAARRGSVIVSSPSRQ
jgi:hypothetical protein